MTRRELLGVCIASLLLALGMTWPLVLHLGSQLPGDPTNMPDPLLEAWTVAWDGHALLHQPLHFFDANAFWPLHDTLAFTDSLAGFAPAGLIGGGTHAAVVRYGMLFLFAYALAFSGAYILARELCAGMAGAALAGVAFAYTPFRLAHESHLHVLASGGIPLSLGLLVRGHRLERRGPIVAGWLVALWQVSLGWNLGLPFTYLMALLSAGALIWWWRVPGDRPPRSLAVASFAGAAVFVTGAVLLALPYINVLDRHPEARRTPDILFFFSPAPRALAAAPHQDLVWGAATSGARASPTGEKALFPGVTVLVLAIVALASGRRRRLAIGLAAAAVVFALLSLGFGLHGGQGGYRLLYDHAPGWQGLRTPGRLATFTTLALAVLGALGAAALARRGGVAVVAVLCALVLLEGYGTIGRIDVPAVPRAAASARSPVLVLPADDDLTNATAMFWSIGKFRPVANGWSGFHPTSYVALTGRITGFPDARSVRALRAYGIRDVVAPADSRAARRSVSGLGIVRRVDGGYVTFQLAPLS